MKREGTSTGCSIQDMAEGGLRGQSFSIILITRFTS